MYSSCTCFDEYFPQVISFAKQAKWNRHAKRSNNLPLLLTTGTDFQAMNLLEVNACSENTLETINDDCLREIYKYLHLLDAVNLARTCTQLFDFANSEILPNKAKQIKIIMQREKIFYSFVEIPTEGTEVPLQYFGQYVKQLTFSEGGPIPIPMKCIQNYWVRYKKVLELCPNLEIIRMENIDFGRDGAPLLKVISTNIKELQLEQCFRISDDWSEEFNRFLKLERISINGIQHFTGAFFANCRNLTDLSICCFTPKMLEMICDRNGPRLKHLKLQILLDFEGFKEIVKLINERLPHLESVEIEDCLAVNKLSLMSEIPQLTSLKIICNSMLCSVNSLLHKLCSEHRIIEVLWIRTGFFAYENKSKKPLNFQYLQDFMWNSFYDSSFLLQALTESQMPKICNFTFYSRDFIPNERNGLLEFLKSKKTLKTIKIIADDITFAFVNEIIEIWKADVSRNRPFLKLIIDCTKIGEKEVSYILHARFANLFLYFFRERL